MRIQIFNYSCASGALRSALNCLHLSSGNFTEAKLMRLCRTNRNGTGEKRLRSAIKKLRLYCLAWNTADRDKAFEKLFNALRVGWPVILCVDKDEHWLTAIGTIGEEIIVFDPEDTYANLMENGLHILSKPDLLKRWKGIKKKYYGLIVSKKPIKS